METFLGRFKNLIVLAAILFAQIIGLAVQVRRPGDEGETRLIRVWALSAVTPIESAVVHSQDWVKNLWTGYIYLRGVRRENRELRAQLDEMKIEQTRLAEDARMARRIQALLAFKEQYVDSTVAAQVIGSSGSDQSRVLYIDKGSKDGIAPDMAVITPTGIVGKVVLVADHSAQVLPINDQFSGVGAALKDSRLQGILKGAPNGATTLQYIMSDEEVKPGEEVITSGGDRIFPRGLPVGKVVTVEPGKDLFLNIRVIPAAQLDRLENVLVVTKITEKLPDTKDLGPIRAADILAERLPTVPPKPATDANGKPIGTAAPGTAAANAAGTTANKPATGGTTTANKPATSGTTTATKPAAAGTATATKPAGPNTAPNPATNGATNTTTPAAAKPKPAAAPETGTAETATNPANGATPPIKVRVVDNDDKSAPPKKPKPAAQEPGNTTPAESKPSPEPPAHEQPAPPPAGATPQP